MKKRLFLMITAMALLFPNMSGGAAAEASGDLTSYEEMFQKDNVINVNIKIRKEDLQDIYTYPKNEEYHSADITVEGITVENAGIRTKGNMTLSSVANSDSDRYSFRIKFNKYVKGQKLLGLDDMCLNNGYSDASYMREYLHYEMLREMGMKVPETAFCNVSVNDELYGFYLAVEALEDSFLERSYGEGQNGNLYKMEEGAALTYREDESYSYANLKSGDDTDLAGFKEFVKKLNEIPDGEKGNIESFLNVDSALIYIAANTVLCNYDSYNNSMKHNYYLYEDESGIFCVIPWDLNMSFGGRESDTNIGIDTPLVSGTMEDSPLISKLLAVAEYKEKYYGYIQEMMNWLENLETRVNELKTIIKPYVENDPSAFYTVEEFEKATTLSEEAAAQPSETENPNDKRSFGGGFGNGKSILNLMTDRLENLKAQFAGTAEKSTLSEQAGVQGMFGGGFPGGFGGENGMQPPGDFVPANAETPESLNPGNVEIPGGGTPEHMFNGSGNRMEPGGHNPFGASLEQADAVIRVHVDGHIITFDTDPVLQNDTTLVGFRAILEALGAEAAWDEATQTAAAVKGNTSIVLTIDSDTAYVNDVAYTLPAAPVIIDGASMVPVRFVSEELGMKVTWDGDTKLITITSK